MGKLKDMLPFKLEFKWRGGITEGFADIGSAVAGSVNTAPYGSSSSYENKFFSLSTVFDGKGLLGRRRFGSWLFWFEDLGRL